jgi:hypothetical protein
MGWIKWAVIGIFAAGALLIWNSGRTGRALHAAAAEINSRAPVNLGSGVRIDRVAVANKSFDIHVTYTDMKAADVVQQKALFDTVLKESMVKTVCRDQHMRRALKEHYDISSIVKGSDGREMTTLRISQLDCG